MEPTEETIAAVRVGTPIHRQPPPGSDVLPCCRRSKYEVPTWHRVTVHPALVTCGKTSTKEEQDG